MGAKNKNEWVWLRLPVKGVSSGSGGRANRVTSDNEGRKLVSFGFRVFSGSFGVT